MRQLKRLLIAFIIVPMTAFAQTTTPTIAVLKFNVNKSAFVVYWQNHKIKHKDDISGNVTVRDRGAVAVVPEEYSAMTNMLTDGLINTLVASHKFKVLTRERVKTVINEQKFTESGYVSQGEAQQAGKLLGADYLVTGSIQMLETKVRQEKIPYTNEVTKQRYGLLVANIQVIDAHSGQIVAAYPVQVSKTQNIEKNQWQQDNEILKSRAYFLQELKDKTTQIAANKILLTVFPLNIIKVAGDTVYINRGVGANFHVGDELAVFKQGQRLTDNQTGQFLGYTESSIGKVRIESIEPKFARAVIVSGDSKNMLDAVVKVVAQKQKPAPRGGGLADTPGSSASPLQW